MDFKLLYNLSFGVFSVHPKNMRFPNIRRVLMVLFIFPLFLLLFTINNFCLLLDYIFFANFLDQKVNRPVFIVAAPRSGTTYLYYSLAEKTDHFTSFKLWELVFAPSIIQKLFWSRVIKLDRKYGGKLKKFALSTEQKLIGDLKTVHPISVNMPEEDEAVLLWDLSSIYLNFFYPDSHFFDDYLLFDRNLDPKVKQRIMKSYRRYVQRHNFVFNRNGDKTFLSKNPLMMCKLESVKDVFPDAKVININRSVRSVIPSTIALNNTLYKMFTSKRSNKELDDRTEEVIISWFEMAYSALETRYKNDHLKVDFKKLVSRDQSVEAEIAEFCEINMNSFLIQKENKGVDHQSKNNYEKLSDEELNSVLNRLPFMKEYSS